MTTSMDLEASMQELVSEFVIKEKDNLSELNQILIRVKNDKMEFENLIKSLEKFLVNTNDNFRKNSVRLISLVIERVKILNFTLGESQEQGEEKIKKLFEFCYGKMRDVVCAPFSVKIIFFLLSYHCKDVSDSFHEEIIKSILNNFKIENFQISSYYQETRFYSLKILTHLIETYKSNSFFQDKILNFIQIVLDGIEGEKDPRNILLMFNLVKNVNRYVDKNLLKMYAKNFFDILEVYYPIEFTPPKNSPDKITPDELIDSLNETFASCEYYLEFLIDVFRDKISSSMIETKVQVLKTIRKVNEQYDLKTVLNPHFITIINLILNEILNNEDEILHVEAIITFKEMIKKFCDEKSELNSDETFDEMEKHIIVNLNKIFEKSEDLLFNCENPKNAFDAKDLIIILVEYANFKSLNFRERALKLCLKLINTYTENGKLFFLKNANSILFFTLKKENPLHFELVEIYIQQNKTFIKNVLFNLLKKYSNQSQSPEETESIMDIITCFIVKTDFVFNEEEVVELFNKIFSTWRECDKSIENHLGICLNELIIKYEKLNNLNFVLSLLESKLKDCIRNEKVEIFDIFKFLHLLQNYSKNKNLTTEILNFIFDKYYFLVVFESENEINPELQKNSYIESIISQLTNILLNIFDNSEIFKSKEGIVKVFIEKFSEIRNKSIKINQNIFKDLCILLNFLIEKLDSNYNDELIGKLINCTEDFVKNNYTNSNLSNESLVASETFTYLHLFLKIIQIILRKRIFDSKLKTDYEDKFYHIFFSFSKNLVIQLDVLFDEIKDSNSQSDNVINLFKRISKNFGLSLYCMNNGLIPKESSQDDLGMKLFHPYFQNLITILNSHIEYPLADLNKNLTISVSILNYMVLYNDKNFPEIVKNLLSTIENVTDPLICQTLENSLIFKFDKKLFSKANKEPIFKLLSILKESYQKLQAENKRYQTKIIISLLLNIYSRFNDDFLEDHSDSILSLCLKALEFEINLKIASSLLREMLKNIDKDFVRKKGYDTKKLIENILNVVSKTNEMQIKIDLLCCLYRLKFVINNWEDKLIKFVLKSLRPILNNKKRLVRKYCGMCINIWSIND